MAITKPTLDQLTGSIDAFVGSLDTDADLLRADFTKEPSLEELDAIAGTMENVDTFGNLDNLSFDFFSVAGSGSLSTTATGTPVFDEFAAGSASIAITQSTLAGVVGEVVGSASVSMSASGAVLKRIPFEGSASLSGALTASCTITVSMTASVDVAFTSTCTPDPDLSKQPSLEELDALVGTMENADQFGNMDTGLIFTFRTADASVSTSMSATAVRSPIIDFAASVSGAASASASAAFIARFDGSASLAVTATGGYERIGTYTTAGTGEYAVTVVSTASGNKFALNGETAPDLTLYEGVKYVFDVSDSTNSGHPLAFQLDDGTSFTNGVARVGTEGTSGATLTVVLPVGLADSSYPARYVCTIHGTGMGADVTVLDTSPTINVAVSAACLAVLFETASAAVSSAATGVCARVQFTAGSADMSMSATMRGKIPGEDWTEVAEGTETWSDVAAGSEVWATVNTGSEVWLRQ